MVLRVAAIGLEEHELGFGDHRLEDSTQNHIFREAGPVPRKKFGDLKKSLVVGSQHHPKTNGPHLSPVHRGEEQSVEEQDSDIGRGESDAVEDSKVTQMVLDGLNGSVCFAEDDSKLRKLEKIGDGYEKNGIH